MFEEKVGDAARKYVFNLDGMHDYLGTLYLPFMPPELLKEVSALDMSGGDVLFGTYPRSGKSPRDRLVTAKQQVWRPIYLLRINLTYVNNVTIIFVISFYYVQINTNVMYTVIMTTKVIVDLPMFSFTIQNNQSTTL